MVLFQNYLNAILLTFATKLRQALRRSNSFCLRRSQLLSVALLIKNTKGAKVVEKNILINY